MLNIQTLTDAEISRMVKKWPSTIARWKVNNPDLYEAVYRGCFVIKYGSN